MGTVGLLFTDVEGSTRLATELGADWPAVLAAHHALVSGAITEEGGFVVSSEGDAFFATFADARAAARAAVAGLRRLRTHSWPAGVSEIKVRMGLHVGYVERTPTGYVGLEIHRAARVAAAAHGGQLLMTSAASALVGDEVDTEPLGAHRLRDFPAAQVLFCAVVDGRGAAFFPPPRTQPVRPTNLPAGTGELVGRELELEQIKHAFLVDGDSMVTLTGRGGVGKTSLALTVARGLLGEHPGGVWLISLAHVSSPDEVLPAIAGVIAAKGGGNDSVLDAIAKRLSGRGSTLIILDNVEHLLPAAVSIAALLDTAPELRLLITSQAPLRIARERCVAIDSLDEGAAIALIESVARRRDASFRVADDDFAVFAEIASLLDGLPLALELAAAQLRVLTPAQLRDRLLSSPDVLRNDLRDRTSRHSSLRATVQWTLESLSEPSRALFARAWAFAAPFELKELEVVAGADGLDVLGALSDLIDVSLIRRVEPGDGRLRFGAPDAVRLIAGRMLDGLPDGERWRREHAKRQHQLQWAARNCWVPEPVYTAAIGADAEAAAALRWALAIGDPLDAPLAAARARLLTNEGRLREAVAVVGVVLGLGPDDPEVQGQAQIAHALTLGVLGRRIEAVDAANAAVSLVRDPESRAAALAVRGLEHLWSGEVDAAVSDHEAATALARDLNPTILSEALFLESQARMQLGQLDLAADLLEAASRAGELGDSPHLWGTHSFKGDLAVLRGRPREALQDYAVALELAQDHNDGVQVYMDLCGLAEALVLNRSEFEAFEVCGLAEAQIADVGAAPGSTFVGEAFQLEAHQRVGAAAAADARGRGREVEAGLRVMRACELARKANRETSQRTGFESSTRR